jgi:hypothetical protein
MSGLSCDAVSREVTVTTAAERSVDHTDAEVANTLHRGDLSSTAMLQRVVRLGRDQINEISNAVQLMSALRSVHRLDLGDSSQHVDDDDLATIAATMPQLSSLTIGTVRESNRGDDSTSLTGTGMTALTSLQHLRHLGLLFCFLSDEGIAAVAQIQHLRSLRVIGCQLSQHALTHIGTMTELTYLNLDRSCIRTFKDLPGSIEGLSNLTYLNLRWAMHACFRHMQGVEPMPDSFRNLRFLNLDSAPLVGGWSEALVQTTPRLQHLILRSARVVHDADLVHVAALSMLHYLDLRCCFALSVEGLTRLHALLRLQYLSFQFSASVSSSDYTSFLEGCTALRAVQAPEAEKTDLMHSEKSTEELTLLVPTRISILNAPAFQNYDESDVNDVHWALHCDGNLWCTRETSGDS